MSGRRGGKTPAVVVFLVALLLVPAARGELVARADLFVKFDGDLAPDALPRDTRAPVAVSMSGVVRTLSGKRPPALRKVGIAVNRGARLDTHGLPTC